MFGCGPRWLSRCNDPLRAGHSGDRIPMGAEIFRTRPDQPWGLFPGVKRPGCGVNHPPQYSAEVKARIELYLCCPWQCHRVNFTFCDFRIPDWCAEAYTHSMFRWPPSSTEVKNERSYKPTPWYAFMARTGTTSPLFLFFVSYFQITYFCAEERVSIQQRVRQTYLIITPGQQI
jgi:hypothetical protein